MKRNLEKRISNYIVDIISIQNIARLYTISRIFKWANISKISLSCIESCFTKVCDSDEFLELGFNSVTNILPRNLLHLTSELEVSDAANSWLIHNIKERNKFVKYLLLTIRLPLLSNHVLKLILNKTLCLYKNNEYVSIIKEVLTI